MERALLLSQGADIEPEHLSTETFTRQPRHERAPVGVALVEVREPPDARWTPEQAAERARVVEALNAEIGNQTRAARRLGVSRATLVNRLRFFDIPRPRKRGP
jgi:DNA-binding NtrC family response regulator